MKKPDNIETLRQYLNELGIRVWIINDKSKHSDIGVFIEEDLHIKVNKYRHKNKTELFLTLLHEACHAIYHLKGYTLPNSLAYVPLNRLNKRERKQLRDFEVNSLKLMPKLAKKLNVSIPMRIIKKQQKLDSDVYNFFYKNGVFP